MTCANISIPVPKNPAPLHACGGSLLPHPRVQERIRVNDASPHRPPVAAAMANSPGGPVYHLAAV